LDEVGACAAFRSEHKYTHKLTQRVASIIWLIIVGTGPADPATAGPIIWRTRIFMFDLYQLSWTCLDRSFYLATVVFCNLLLILLSDESLCGEAGLLQQSVTGNRSASTFAYLVYKHL